MLKELKKATGLDGRLTGSILDQGDAVGAWQSDSMAVVVFPTAETLKQANSDRPQPCYKDTQPFSVGRCHAAEVHQIESTPDICR